MSVPEPAREVVRFRVVVTGRVQNVGFRDGTRRQAEQQSVSGWVRNLPHGPVEAELEGPRPKAEALVRWLRTGPRLAAVEHVDVRVVTPTGGDSFEVH